MSEINRAKRLIEAATSDSRVIAGEIAALGFACIYLYKRRTDGETTTTEDLSGTVVNEIFDDGDETVVFTHSHKSIQEGVPFKFGINTKIDGRIQLVAVSGVRLVRDIGDKASDAWANLFVSEDSVDNPSHLELLKDKLHQLRQQFEQPDNTNSDLSD